MRITTAKVTHNKSKRTQPVQGIVLHRTAGYFQGSVAWLTRKDNKSSSAHFVIGRNGEDIAQLADPAAFWTWHAGIITQTASKVPSWARINPNYRSIGIEFADDLIPERLKNPYFWTEQQMRQGIELILAMCEQFNIPVTRNHIIGHMTVDPSRKPNDPSWQFMAEVYKRLKI